MPNKRVFTRKNSTKFVLYTDGRDKDGNKIQENVLIPVTSKHVPGNSLLISHIASLYEDSEAEKRGKEILDKKASKSKKKKKNETDKEPDLNEILGQMEDSDADDESETEESEHEDYDALLKKMEKLFNHDPSTSRSHSNLNVQPEVFEEEGSDFSDEFGQFSDAESFSDSEDEDCKPRRILKCPRPDCPEDIKMLNEGFEKVLAEYEDNQIGALDDEEIGGTFTTENEHVMKLITTPFFRKNERPIEIGEFDDSLKKKILLFQEVEEPEKFVQITTEEKKIEFDCESILSTYSNIYNHPFTIKEESKIRKIRIPQNPLKKTLTKGQLKQLDDVSECDTEEDEEDAISMATSFNIRNKDETPEQRKERKALFKEAKRESRILKKENKLAFKNEKKVQKANAMNIRNNIGIKLP